MNILAIDTSASACSLALVSGDKVYYRHEIVPMQQTACVLPFLESLLFSAKLPLQSLQAIAYGEGPGRFTGLRIATSVAKALGFALNIPLIPISSLEALAHHALDHCAIPPQYILTAIDARMDEIYWAAFEVCEQVILPLTPPRLSAPETLTLPKDGVWQGVGDAWAVYQTRMGVCPSDVNSEANPEARSILFLAKAAFKAGKTVSALEACPIYLRNQVTFDKSLNSDPSQR